jgi:hypothetical protein
MVQMARGVLLFSALLSLGARASELTPASSASLAAAPRAEEALAAVQVEDFEQALQALDEAQRARVLELLRTPLSSWEEVEHLEEAFRRSDGAANPLLMAWIVEPASEDDPLGNQHFVTLSSQSRPTKLKLERTPCVNELWPLDRCGRALRASIAIASGADYREISLFEGSPEGFVALVEAPDSWRAFRRGVWARLEMLKLPRDGEAHLDERLALIHHLPQADRASFRKRQLAAVRLLSSP